MTSSHVRWFGFMAVMLCAGAVLMKPVPSFSQGAGTPLTGYAWSDTVGWVSLNCSNDGTCATSNYGMAIDGNGLISGYAWSENVGWISANGSDLTGCPSGTCTARFEDYALRGWMKAVAGGSAQSGGWDGFISLNGTNYGPTLSAGTIDGYAWGSDVVGWLDFASGVHSVTTTWLPPCATNYQCVSATARQNTCASAPVEECGGALICSAGACVLPPAPFTGPEDALTVSPSLISYGATVTISWNVQNADSCTLTEDNPDITDSWNTVSGSETTSALTRPTTYTLFCTGPGGDFTQTATVSRRPDWREI